MRRQTEYEHQIGHRAKHANDKSGVIATSRTTFHGSCVPKSYVYAYMQMRGSSCTLQAQAGHPRRQGRVPPTSPAEGECIISPLVKCIKGT